RRKDKQVLDKSWIEDVLKRGTVMCLGLAAPDGDPYVVPMGYGYDEGIIYLHGAMTGLKNDLIAVNPRVSFNVFVDAEVIRSETGVEFSSKYKSVTGFGEISEITDLDEKNHALAILMRQYNGPHDDLPEEKRNSVWVAKIVIREMYGKSSGYAKL
ncbi:MAG: pyridoxamine 5'-phosphate oxidase family protein, partial [Synergistaceae bacterium]|nr:pyridoxamine 5'-phosphate oxidase family protein [Synergistaceae bacterium]